VARKVQAVRKAFGAVLRELREESKLSQWALADKAEIDRNYVGLLERGERSPTIDVVVSLSNALKVPAHTIVKRMEDRFGEPASRARIASDRPR
jgi:transcriptional regulator with XRE-family HTH domain